MAGQGGYENYLLKWRHNVSPNCPTCNYVEVAEHAVFKCLRFEEGRRRVENEIGHTITAENIVDCQTSNSKWFCSTQPKLTYCYKLRREGANVMWSQYRYWSFPRCNAERQYRVECRCGWVGVLLSRRRTTSSRILHNKKRRIHIFRR